MKQIDYFKFLKIFPEFIDIEDSIDVKTELLKKVREDTWRKKERSDLLPIKIIDLETNKIPDVEYFKRFDIMSNDFEFRITYKREMLIDICYLQYLGKWIVYIYKNPLLDRNNFRIMEREEIINLKRTIIIDNILK